MYWKNLTDVNNQLSNIKQQGLLNIICEAGMRVGIEGKQLKSTEGK